LPLYNYFVEKLGLISGLKVATGEFGADMKIKSINDGPVTLFIDSKNKE
jgi:D-tyrosyl-tRNA(Tyr) deacylase